MATAKSGFDDAYSRPSLSFQRVMDSAPVAAMALAGDGLYVYQNQAAESLLGYDASQLVGKHLTDLVQDDATKMVRAWDMLKSQRSWRGLVFYKKLRGGVVRVAMNAFTQSMRGASSVYIALLHPVGLDVPDLEQEAGLKEKFGLTAGEVRLLQLMSEGFADKEIAALLDVTVWTINKEVGNVLRKMAARSRTEACVIAIRGRIVL